MTGKFGNATRQRGGRDDGRAALEAEFAVSVGDELSRFQAATLIGAYPHSHSDPCSHTSHRMKRLNRQFHSQRRRERCYIPGIFSTYFVVDIKIMNSSPKLPIPQNDEDQSHE